MIALLPYKYIETDTFNIFDFKPVIKGLNDDIIMSYFENALNAVLEDKSEPLKINIAYYKNVEASFSNQSERKNIPCRFFVKNQCMKSDCPYSHERENGRQQKYKTELCSNFQKEGFCKFNDTCTFAHGENQRRQYS